VQLQSLLVDLENGSHMYGGEKQELVRDAAKWATSNSAIAATLQERLLATRKP